MGIENKIGQNFDNLAQRMVYVYLGTFPSFVPAASAFASQAAQRQMCDFVRGILVKTYDDPSLLNLPAFPDDCYENWMCNNQKPELIKAMRKIDKGITGFFLLLEQIGEAGEIEDGTLRIDKNRCRVNATVVQQLRHFGVNGEDGKTTLVLSSEAFPAIFPAWKLLAKITARQREILPVPYRRDALLVFLHGTFDPEQPHASEAFAALSGDRRRFQALEAFFVDAGYRRAGSEVFNPGGTPDLQISLCWHKHYTAKDAGGIFIWYDFRKKDQLKFDLRASRFRELLQAFAQMDDELKDLVLARTKPCNACDYCTQTNKAKRQLATFTATHRGTTYQVCPFFPSLTWHYLDDAAVSGMIKLLSFAETTLRAGLR